LNGFQIPLFVMVLWAPIYIFPSALCLYIIRKLAKSSKPMLIADWASLGFPWFVWFLTVHLMGIQKSLSNLGEGYLLVVVCVVTYWIRLRLEPQAGTARPVAMLAFLFICVVAVLFAFFIPPLPE
jgi:hypothetical protein